MSDDRFRVDMHPAEILTRMQSGADRDRTVGVGLLTYRAAELTAKATDRLKFETRVLWAVALVQAIIFAIDVIARLSIP